MASGARGLQSDVVAMWSSAHVGVGEGAEACRSIARKFDHKRIVPLIPVFAAAFKAKGFPLPCALLDGTSRDFCRP